MSKTNIAWTQETWNPVVGCTPASPGCDNCYARDLHNKRHRAYLEGKLQACKQYAEPFSKIQLFKDRLSIPLKRRTPTTFFVNSMSDLFHEDVPFEFIDKIFCNGHKGYLIPQRTPHVYQILTKRPERMLEYFKRTFPGWFDNDWKRSRGKLEQNQWINRLWLGVTAENQEQFDKRWTIASQIPASVLFVSGEPLLGPIDFSKHERKPDWFIVGGETGKNARPMHPDWVRGLRDQCVAAGIPFFFKSWGERVSESQAPRSTVLSTHSFCPSEWDLKNKDSWVYRVGKKRAGNLLDGRVWQQMPEVQHVTS